MDPAQWERLRILVCPDCAAQPRTVDGTNHLLTKMAQLAGFGLTAGKPLLESAQRRVDGVMAGLPG